MKLSPVTVRKYRGIGKLEDTSDTPPGTLLGARNVQLAPVGGLMSPPQVQRLWGLGTLSDLVLRHDIGLLYRDAVVVEAIMTFVLAMRAAGLWDLMLGVYPLVATGGNQETAAVDIRGTWPIHWIDADGMTFDGDGVTGDGTGYGNTGYNLLDRASPTDFGLTVASSGAIPMSGQGLIGGYDLIGAGASNHETFILTNGATNIAGPTVDRANITPSADLQIITTTRTGNLVSAYVGGAAVDSSTTSVATHPDEIVAIGAVSYNETGTAQAEKTLAFAAFHLGLSAAQTATLHTLVTALQTDLGRGA